jgi:hypothetical protein
MKWLATLALAAIVGTSWMHARAQRPIHVDYYYIPYCMSCARVLHSLDALSRELGDRVEVHTADCFSDEGRAAAKKYGFVTHGIVVSEPRRGLIFQQKDHGVSGDDVRVVVRNELGMKP